MSVPIPIRRSRFPGEFLINFQQNPIALLRDAAERYGDAVSLRGDRDRVYLVNHPDLIREVLVTQDKSFKKGRALENARRFLGNGLLTSEGESHRRQRRMIAPAFHRRQIERYAAVAASGARRANLGWRDGARIEALSEMMAITMPIVAETLFGASMGERASAISAALDVLVSSFRLTMLPGMQLLERLPLPGVVRLHWAEETLHDAVESMIAERRRAPVKDEEETDLLGMLIASQDEEAEAGSAERGMSDQQIHDEVLTLFIAGWAWYLLSQHPEVEERLRREIGEVLKGEAPGFDDVPRLVYARLVLLETLRLYPPAWAIGRRSLVDVELGEYCLPAGSIVVISPAVTQVDARFWDQPMRFDPDRWADESVNAARPKFSFFPFGGGSRICIGEQFAWMEAVLVLVTLMQEWRLRLVEGARVEARPMVTLRPKGGVGMWMERVG